MIWAVVVLLALFVGSVTGIRLNQQDEKIAALEERVEALEEFTHVKYLGADR